MLCMPMLCRPNAFELELLLPTTQRQHVCSILPKLTPSLTSRCGFTYEISLNVTHTKLSCQKMHKILSVNRILDLHFTPRPLFNDLE
jgi:hypothetical protein